MSMFLALAAATLPLPTPAQAADIRCVALLAIVASEQKNGTGGANYPDLKDRGADFAAVVGEDVMKATGRTREQVRDLMVAAVANVQKAKALPRAETEACIALMAKRVPDLPPPTLPRCAAIMGLAYDAVKKRDGLTKDAKDLATLAAVLTYRAQVELRGTGKSDAETETLIGVERETATKAGGASEAELQRCAAFAQPEAPR